MSKRKVIIMGAAGRDFHNFNVYFRDNKGFQVVAFTATQIPGISGRKYPRELAGRFYPKGIPIYSEKDLVKLIKKFDVDEVVFSYSDVSHQYVMEKASLVLSAGASFSLLGPKDSMIESSKPVIAVCAVRTGCGKSQISRAITKWLKARGKKVGVIRHPMPYGNLKEQAVQRFAKYSDLTRQKCTVEEREEYEPDISEGLVAYTGVDYKKILKKAEKELDIILWDGGNNDFSFYKPDLLFVVTDPFRQGDETTYHPGHACLLMADIVIVNKVNTAKKKDVIQLMNSIKEANPKAKIIKTNSVFSIDSAVSLKGKKVLCIEDGPTLTHGEMTFGAAYLAAKKAKAKIVDPKKFAVGSIKEAFKNWPSLKVLPALGYSVKQLNELQQTINKTRCDLVLSGTPIDLSKIIKSNKPVVHVSYKLDEFSQKKLWPFLKAFV